MTVLVGVLGSGTDHNKETKPAFKLFIAKKLSYRCTRRPIVQWRQDFHNRRKATSRKKIDSGGAIQRSRSTHKKGHRKSIPAAGHRHDTGRNEECRGGARKMCRAVFFLCGLWSKSLLLLCASQHILVERKRKGKSNRRFVKGVFFCLRDAAKKTRVCSGRERGHGGWRRRECRWRAQRPVRTAAESWFLGRAALGTCSTKRSAAMIDAEAMTRAAVETKARG